MGEQPWTVLRLLNWTADYLSREGVEQGRLCAEMLLACAVGCSRIELYTRFDQELPPEQLTTFRENVKRAANHEPAAYLIGRKEFYSLEFKVTPAVLVPRCETEILVAEAIAHLESLARPGRVWDICTGSGCVACAIASNIKNASVLATDISADAVAIASENVATLGLADRLTCLQADLLSLPADISASPPFDVITANPPYVAEDDPVGESIKFEPKLALIAGDGGLEFIKPIIRDAPALLAAGGLLAIEFGYRHADKVRDLIIQSGAFAEPRIIRDHQNIDRAIAAKKL